MKRLLEDIPSIPQIPSMAPLHLGITTRVMAKKQSLQRERDRDKKNSVANSEDEYESWRRSSKFLEGAAIPNSIIKSELQQSDSLPKDRDSIRKERDEFVAELMKRLEPRKTMMYHSIYDEDVDREALNRIKKELQRRSLLPLAQRREIDKSRRSLSIASGVLDKPNKDPWEELKEKRRITRRTSILAPLSGERRSTYESIKKAIQNSRVIQQLLNADNIEEQKVKQVQTGKSLMPIDENMPGGTKREGSRNSRDRRAKRKHSLKSEKSYNLPSEKILMKKKAIADVRKHPK